MKAKELLITIFVHIIAVFSENCGIKSSPEWPWSVSLFYDTSNLVQCQGTIISDRHVLTAGHCLQHKHLSSLLVYPGLLFYRPNDDAHNIPWQLEQINLHPDMKLTSHGRFINGGFVATMEIHADLAIGTLKQVIQFNDTISAVCLSSDNTTESDELLGSFSGWNSVNKTVENFNKSIDGIDGEIFKVLQEKKSVKIIEGTGIYEENNSSWSIIGLMTMNDFNTNGIENIQFINLHMYANWITNFLENSSSDASTKTSTIQNTLTTLISSTVSLMGNMSSTSIESSTHPYTLGTSIFSAENSSSLVSNAIDAVAKLKSRLLSFPLETTTSNIVSSDELTKTSTTSPDQTTNSIAIIKTTIENVNEKINLETSTRTTLDKVLSTISSTEAVKTVTENSVLTTDNTLLKIESTDSNISKYISLTTEASINKSSIDFTKASTIMKPMIESSTTTKNILTTLNMPNLLLPNSTSSENSIDAKSEIKTLLFTEIPSTSASYKVTERINDKNSSNANYSTVTAVMPTESNTIENETTDKIDKRNSISKSTEAINNSKPTVTENVDTTTTTASIMTTTPQTITTLLSKNSIEDLNETTIATVSRVLSTKIDDSLHTNDTLSTNKPLSTISAALSTLNELPVTENIALPVSIASKMSENLSNVTPETPKTRMSQGRSLDGFNTNDTISSTLNSTMVSQNSTMSDENQPLLASTGLDASVLIAIVFIASVFLLFIIFCALGSQKPSTGAH